MYERDERPAQTNQTEIKAGVTIKIEEKEETTDVIGVVTDCLNLNLRTDPVTGSDIITTLPALTEVTVDLNESVGDFYKICTAAGIEGFCMKKYIAIRP